jgi:hypothetical protein
VSEQQIAATAEDQQGLVTLRSDIGCGLHGIGGRGKRKIGIALLIHTKRVVMEQRIVWLYFHGRLY